VQQLVFRVPDSYFCYLINNEKSTSELKVLFSSSVSNKKLRPMAEVFYCQIAKEEA